MNQQFDRIQQAIDHGVSPAELEMLTRQKVMEDRARADSSVTGTFAATSSI